MKTRTILSSLHWGWLSLSGYDQNPQEFRYSMADGVQLAVHNFP